MRVFLFQLPDAGLKHVTKAILLLQQSLALRVLTVPQDIDLAAENGKVYLELSDDSCPRVRRRCPLHFLADRELGHLRLFVHAALGVAAGVAAAHGRV